MHIALQRDNSKRSTDSSNPSLPRSLPQDTITPSPDLSSISLSLSSINQYIHHPIILSILTSLVCLLTLSMIYSRRLLYIFIFQSSTFREAISACIVLDCIELGVAAGQLLRIGVFPLLDLSLFLFPSRPCLPFSLPSSSASPARSPGAVSNPRQPAIL